MATAESIIGVHDFQMQVCEALGLDPGRVGRIIIDLDCNNCGPIPIYVEMIGDDRLLSVDWGKGLEGAKIIREPEEASNLPYKGDIRRFCPLCNWRGTTYDCDSDENGEWCPDCGTTVKAGRCDGSNSTQGETDQSQT